jgi:N-acetylglucosaminyl-diphospho-decaprenol L-rhamnosyltransferase
VAETRPPTNPDLSVITVTYQNQDQVLDALSSAASAAAELGLVAEMIVVDNASTDGSADAVAAAHSATVIRNAQNVGFGRANNQAFEVARGKRWLLLNPDARIDARSLNGLMTVLDDDPTAAAVAPSLVSPGRDAESAGMHPSVASAIGHFWFVNRIPGIGSRGPLAGFQLRASGSPLPVRVDWASAAVLLLRPGAIRAVGGFDPSIFMYGEDVDLGRRLRSARWDIVLVPAAKARHGIAVGRGVSTEWLAALHRLVHEERGRPHAIAFDAVAATGLGLRALVEGFRGKPAGRLQRARMAAAARRALGLMASELRGARTPRN